MDERKRTSIADRAPKPDEEIDHEAIKKFAAHFEDALQSFNSITFHDLGLAIQASPEQFTGTSNTPPEVQQMFQVPFERYERKLRQALEGAQGNASIKGEPWSDALAEEARLEFEKLMEEEPKARMESAYERINRESWNEPTKVYVKRRFEDAVWIRKSLIPLANELAKQTYALYRMSFHRDLGVMSVDIGRDRSNFLGGPKRDEGNILSAYFDYNQYGSKTIPLEEAEREKVYNDEFNSRRKPVCTIQFHSDGSITIQPRGADPVPAEIQGILEKFVASIQPAYQAHAYPQRAQE